MENMRENNCQIVAKASELFLTKGFKSVTMDDIANEMGISKKTIYQSFKTKTDLISAVGDHIFDAIKCGIHDIRERTLNPIDEFYTINDYVIEHLKDETTAPEYQLSKYYPLIHSRLSSMKYDEIQDCVSENLNRGIELGLYRTDIDIPFVIGIYFIGVGGIRNQDIFPNENFKPKKITHSYLDYHIRGIASEKGIMYLENFKKKRNQKNQIINE